MRKLLWTAMGAAAAVFGAASARAQEVRFANFLPASLTQVQVDQWFADELERTCSAISGNPLIGRPLSARTRRWLMDVFPYLVLYRVLANDVLILKVVHEKRDPAGWQSVL